MLFFDDHLLRHTLALVKKYQDVDTGGQAIEIEACQLFAFIMESK